MRVSEAVPEQRSGDEQLDRQPVPDNSSEMPVLAKPYPPGLPQVAVQQPAVSELPRAQNLQRPSTEVAKELRRQASLRAGFVPRDRAELRRAIVLVDLDDELVRSLGKNDHAALKRALKGVSDL